MLRNQVIGTMAPDPVDGGILRAPSRLLESEMGNLVADAMVAKYPGVEAALTNSGGLRQDLFYAPTGAEAPGEITWGEVFAVLPFGNRTVILTLTGDLLTQALLNGYSPVCNPAIATGRFPQVSGLQIEFRCNGTTPEIVSAQPQRRHCPSARPTRSASSPTTSCTSVEAMGTRRWPAAPTCSSPATT